MGKMGKLSLQFKNELRDTLFPLAKGCPIDQSNPRDCQFYHIRFLSGATQLQWFDALSVEALSYLLSNHQVCLNTKLTALMAGIKG